MRRNPRRTYMRDGTEITPMDIANAKANGVSGVEASCMCGHEAKIAFGGMPDYPCPEPQTVEHMKSATAELGYRNNETVRAWTYNAYGKRVTHGCYSSASHSTEGARTSTQTQGGPWFNTEADAHRAMRWAVTRRMAIELAEIDATTPD